MRVLRFGVFLGLRVVEKMEGDYKIKSSKVVVISHCLSETGSECYF